MTGTISYEPSTAADRLLSALPSMMVMRFAPDDPREWLDVSSRLLRQEVIDPLPGATVMVSRIIDLLFVQTLRAWARGTDQPPNWLVAAMDPCIGPVLTALHRDPGRSWTVASMAALAHMSRSAFSEHFVRLAGQPPMQYLVERRLDHARELLRTTSLPIHTIGARIGYTSDAAFSRAFRRHLGVSPLQWRRG